MKLSTALTALIAIQRHGHRMVCAWASADDHERKLLINQAEAAKRVNDAVDLAMASVDAGDVHGVALPLNYILQSDRYQFLTVALRLPGVDWDQHVMIDTGSSSLAFCNKSLIEEAVNITKTAYAQCDEYGGANNCPDDPASNLSTLFFVGQVFQGNIAAYNTNTGEEIASMDDANFGIMSKAQMGLCNGPLDGDMGNNTVTFVDLKLSNETEAFIDGPGLGGMIVEEDDDDDDDDQASTTNEPSTSSEPSTGSRHTGRPSTDTFVMAGLFCLPGSASFEAIALTNSVLLALFSCLLYENSLLPEKSSRREALNLVLVESSSS